MSQVLRTKLKVAEGGRIVIPAEVRQRLGMDAGSEVVMTVDDDHLILMNARAARRKARERVRRYIRGNVNLSDELRAERKAEAKRE